MKTLVRAEAYLPRRSHDGRRVVSFDEDEFTMAVTVLERLLGSLPAPSGPVDLALVGASSAVPDELWSVWVGRPLRVQRGGSGAASLKKALESAAADTGPNPAFVVASEVGEPSGPGHSIGDGAVLFLLAPAGPAPEVPVLPWNELDLEDLRGPALDAAFALSRRAHGQDPAVWAGDWTLDPGAGAAVDAALLARRNALGVGAVSEGAYVPRSRYLDSLTSRWRFVADRCAACGATTFPLRGSCRGCGARSGVSPVHLPLDGGTVVAATEIGRGGQPTEFDFLVDAAGPYSVVLVDLAPGARATLQASESPTGGWKVGDRVATRLRRLYPMEGEWRYGRKALPLPAEGASP